MRMPMVLARLRVTMPNGQVQEHPLDPGESRIGAASGNAIVVSHLSVSPWHCGLRASANGFLLEDFDSDSGTYIDGRRLAAGVATPVQPGQEIRIGQVDAVVMGLDDAVRPGPETRREQTGGQQSTQTFSVKLHGPTAPVVPGSSATAVVEIQNQGSRADDFTIRVENQPSWMQVTRPNVAMAPGTKEEISVVIQPPQASEPYAGEHEFAVAVTSREQSHTVLPLGTLTIARFDRMGMRVQPPRSRGSFRVTLSNLGNDAVEYRLAGSDEAGELAYDFSAERVSIEPGREVDIGLKVHSIDRRWFGKAETLKFDVEAVPEGAAPERPRAPAQVEIVPPLRHWRWWLFGLFLLVAAGIGGTIAALGPEDTPLLGGLIGDDDEVREQPTEAATEEANETQPPVTEEATEPPEDGDGEIRVGGQVQVVNAPEVGPNGNRSCLRVRAEPSIDGQELGDVCDGTVMLIAEGPFDTPDGFRFWGVALQGGGVAFVAESTPGGDVTFLEPVD